eukprot:CAMPEP_0177662010 /NCGR_PEP_ID=MMETSP0447-20121125/19033_1 /TAXON_ID=0 /ORGANISM="Stygamoeba regulata, Strain BSH-02190019" /LENGTH=1525 /DNA_ID=CAMNT_0019167489 /DNA_START=72 /DNA_END=4649 /DNA_ORIENTATION=-
MDSEANRSLGLPSKRKQLESIQLHQLAAIAQSGAPPSSEQLHKLRYTFPYGDRTSQVRSAPSLSYLCIATVLIEVDVATKDVIDASSKDTSSVTAVGSSLLKLHHFQESFGDSLAYVCPTEKLDPLLKMKCFHVIAFGTGEHKSNVLNSLIENLPGDHQIVPTSSSASSPEKVTNRIISFILTIDGVNVLFRILDFAHEAEATPVSQYFLRCADGSLYFVEDDSYIDSVHVWLTKLSQARGLNAPPKPTPKAAAPDAHSPTRSGGGSAILQPTVKAAQPAAGAKKKRFAGTISKGKKIFQNSRLKRSNSSVGEMNKFKLATSSLSPIPALAILCASAFDSDDLIPLSNSFCHAFGFSTHAFSDSESMKAAVERLGRDMIGGSEGPTNDSLSPRLPTQAKPSRKSEAPRKTRIIKKKNTRKGNSPDAVSTGAQTIVRGAARTSLEEYEYVPPSNVSFPVLVNEGSRSIQVSFWSFKYGLGSNLELHFSIYCDGEPCTSEFTVHVPMKAQMREAPKDLETSPPLHQVAIFKDLTADEWNRHLSLVCRVVRIGEMFVDDSNVVKDCRILVGYGCQDIDVSSGVNGNTPGQANLLEMDIFAPGGNEEFTSLFERVLNAEEREAMSPAFPAGVICTTTTDPVPNYQRKLPPGLRVVEKTELTVYENPNIQTRPRNELAIHLTSGGFGSVTSSSGETQAEVQMSVRLKSGWDVKECLTLGGSARMDTYRSPLLRSNHSTFNWNETVHLIDLPTGEIHLFFKILLYHSKMVEERYAFLRLDQSAREGLDDGSYTLRCGACPEYMKNTSTSTFYFHIPDSSIFSDEYLNVKITRHSTVLPASKQFRGVVLWDKLKLEEEDIVQYLEMLLSADTSQHQKIVLSFFPKLIPPLLKMIASRRSFAHLAKQVLAALCAVPLVELPEYRPIVASFLPTYKCDRISEVSLLMEAIAQCFAEQDTSVYLDLLVTLFRISHYDATESNWETFEMHNLNKCLALRELTCSSLWENAKARQKITHLIVGQLSYMLCQYSDCTTDVPVNSPLLLAIFDTLEAVFFNFLFEQLELETDEAHALSWEEARKLLSLLPRTKHDQLQYVVQQLDSVPDLDLPPEDESLIVEYAKPLTVSLRLMDSMKVQLDLPEVLSVGDAVTRIKAYLITCPPIRERNISLAVEDILIFDQDGAELDDDDHLKDVYDPSECLHVRLPEAVLSALQKDPMQQEPEKQSASSSQALSPRRRHPEKLLGSQRQAPPASGQAKSTTTRRKFPPPPTRDLPTVPPPKASAKRESGDAAATASTSATDRPSADATLESCSPENPSSPERQPAEDQSAVDQAPGGVSEATSAQSPPSAANASEKPERTSSSPPSPSMPRSPDSDGDHSITSDTEEVACEIGSVSSSVSSAAESPQKCDVKRSSTSMSPSKERGVHHLDPLGASTRSTFRYDLSDDEEEEVLQITCVLPDGVHLKFNCPTNRTVEFMTNYLQELILEDPNSLARLSTTPAKLAELRVADQTGAEFDSFDIIEDIYQEGEKLYVLL